MKIESPSGAWPQRACLTRRRRRGCNINYENMDKDVDKLTRDIEREKSWKSGRKKSKALMISNRTPEKVIRGPHLE